MSDEPLKAIVYLNIGWWVAECPRPFCDNATWFGVATNGAGVGGLTPDYMMCAECQTAWPAVWPDPELRKGIEQIVADRPDPLTRNWLPGEQLATLMLENAEHGITPSPAAIEASKERGGVILTVAGEEVTAGARELVAPHRLSIAGGQS